MSLTLFDTHAHYDARQFDPDRDQVLSALPGQGVELVVNPGCDLASSRKAEIGRASGRERVCTDV